MATVSTLSDLMAAPQGCADDSTKGTSSCSSNNKRKSASLPSEAVEYLKNWMMSAEHIAHPYPTEQEKADIMKDTGIELKQLTNWFVNNRKRYWKPRVEARIQRQASAATAAVQAHAAAVAAVHAAQSAHQQQQQVQVQHHHAATAAAAAALSVVTIAASTALVNPVSPETTFNKTSQQQQLLSPFASFGIDLERTTTMHQLQQQHRHHQHQVVPSPPNSCPTMLTASALAQRQVGPTPVVASVSETSSTASVSGSEEDGDGSDDTGSSYEDDGIKNVDDQRVTFSSSSEMQATIPESPQTSRTSTRLQTIVNQAISNGARNVSFCSLEQASGETSTQATTDEVVIRTVQQTPSVAPTFAPATGAIGTTTPVFVARSIQPKKRPHCNNHNIVENSLLVDVPADAGDDVATDLLSSSSSTTPRKRFRRMSLDMWIDACKSASDNEDESLPSLEEATRLFGYCN
jgi:hypothetical protein